MLDRIPSNIIIEILFISTHIEANALCLTSKYFIRLLKDSLYYMIQKNCSTFIFEHPFGKWQYHTASIPDGDIGFFVKTNNNGSISKVHLYEDRIEVYGRHLISGTLEDNVSAGNQLRMFFKNFDKHSKVCKGKFAPIDIYSVSRSII